MRVEDGSGTALFSISTGSTAFLDLELAYHKQLSLWTSTPFTIRTTPYALVVGGRRVAIENANLPEDGTFAPVILE